MVGRYFSFTSCQLERISSRNVIHVNTEPKTRSCNTFKSMSLVCQNAEDNAYVMIEICFRFDNVLSGTLILFSFVFDLPFHSRTCACDHRMKPPV